MALTHGPTLIPWLLLWAAPVQDAPTPGALELLSADVLEWREVGPYRGGRSAAVAGVPGRPDLYYFGSTGGGVWKSEDAGSSWRNISDGFFGGSIGSVAVSESDPNVVWVGTGEKTVRGNVSHGDGVWRSVDAGKTWKHVGLPDSRHLTRIRVHPNDPDTAWVSALGHLFGPNHERGVFRTTDGGESWEHVLFENEEVGAVDLVLDPSNPRVLYASTWRVLRTPYSLESGGEGSGLWKSTDGGDHWTALHETPGFARGMLGIIGVSVSASHPESVYAIVEAEQGGVFRSRDGGESWSRTSAARELRQRAWYYSRIVADPVDAETVYVLNVRFHRSTDGGKSFTPIATPHGDNHDLWIAPEDPLRMIQSNDGGANVSKDGGKTWSRQDNQPTAQMYRVSTDDDFPYRLLGGQQDNSAVRIRSRSAGGSSIGIRDWEATAGGESGHIVAQPGQPDVVYGGSYGGYLLRYDHRSGGRRRIDVWPDDPIGHGAEDARYRFQWNFPLFFSPHDADTLYAAANVLFRTRDEGASWQAISPDLTHADPKTLGASGGPITKDNTGVEVYATIFAALESPHQAGVFWCGSDDGRLHLSRDDGESWQEVTPPALPPRTMINSLETDPFEPSGIYVVGTRYKLDDFEPYLFHSDDWGTTWRRIDEGLDRSAFSRVLRADPERRDLLYCGTEAGVHVSFDAGASWQSLQTNLPIVPITDMAVKEGDLVAATQGRGFWILDDLSLLRQFDESQLESPAHLFTPRPVHLLPGRRAEDPVGAGTNPPAGVVITYHLKDEPGAESDLTLKIQNADGRSLRSYLREPSAEEQEEDSGDDEDEAVEDPRQLPAEAGFNRFVWDLRWPAPDRFDGLVVWNDVRHGPRVAPGEYRATLSLGDWSQVLSFEVRADPRSGATREELVAQETFLLEIVDLLSRMHSTVRELRTLRADLNRVADRIDKDHGELAQALRDFVAETTEVEQALHQTRNESRQDPLNFPIRLNDKLGGLYQHVATGDAAPTSQAKAVWEELSAAAERELEAYERLVADALPDLERRLDEAGVGALVR